MTFSTRWYGAMVLGMDSIFVVFVGIHLYASTKRHLLHNFSSSQIHQDFFLPLCHIFKDSFNDWFQLEVVDERWRIYILYGITFYGDSCATYLFIPSFQHPLELFGLCVVPLDFLFKLPCKFKKIASLACCVIAKIYLIVARQQTATFYVQPSCDLFVNKHRETSDLQRLKGNNTTYYRPYERRTVRSFPVLVEILFPHYKQFDIVAFRLL